MRLALSPSLLATLAAVVVSGCASGVDPAAPTPDGSLPPDGSVADSAAPPDAGDGGGACSADADCADGLVCNGEEICGADGVCAAGTPVVCDDGVDCTTDTCDELDGSCASVEDDGVCAAGLVCDAVAGCSAPRECEADGDCDDGLFCNGEETCDPAFGCLRGTAPSCDDLLGCTIDRCDETLAAGVGACLNTPDDGPCGDGIVCNGIEACDPLDAAADANGCIAGAAPDCDDGVDCTVDACTEMAGGCENTADASVCDDGVFCNGAEACDPASITGCVDGAAPDCDDGIGCTVGSCDAATDACAQAADAAFCADGLVCNGDEQCDTSGVTPGDGCVAGIPLDCGDGLVCTTDICNEPTGACTYGGSDADMDGFTAVGCGTGMDCNDLSAAVNPSATEVCDGIDNDCSGGTDDGAGMQCALGSGARACTTSCSTAGVQSCNAACSLTPCVATSETCNDCDDDGNGVVDDGLTCRRDTTSGCTTSCGTAGSRTCASDCSGYSACAASAETCNDCDDDGNGLVDDGLTCRRGTAADCTTSCGTAGRQTCALDCSGYGTCAATAETCNGCDDDGNGLVDDGLPCRMGATMACTTACGTAGVRSCAADCSGFGTCVAATETCNGCDDDGDSMVDETFSCEQGATSACTTSCGSPGTETCNATCSGLTACAGSEICNGCDDDGDGSPDEDFACVLGATMGCTTSCGSAGTRACNGTCTGFGVCRAAAEECNACDDDGDAMVDEGFACVSGSSQGCTTSCGTAGTQACNGGCSGYDTCSASSETCNGCDDDGDMMVDESFSCAQGESQGCTTSCGTAGTQTCGATCAGFDTCAAAAETCNGCDDDGDGSPDEDFVCVQGASRACTTMCGTAGTETCNGACSGHGSCAAAAEVCGNGCDDDGDGMVDEGCAVAPGNDLCGGATTLTGATGTRTDTFDGATLSASGCGAGGEIWYSFTLASSQIVYVDTFGSTFDTRLSLRSSCGGAALQCEDDDCGTVQEQLTRVLSAGTYYVAVHAHSAATTTGTVNLRWQMISATGDDTLIAGNGTYTGSTSGSGLHQPVSCGASSAGASAEDGLYFTLCPSTTRSVSADTCTGTSYDSTLWLRSAGDVQAACNDDSCGLQSDFTQSITGPGLFLILVDGYSTATGSYSVSVTGL